MRETENVGLWVVYRVPAHGRQGGMSALCTQREWEAMERATPGHYALVRAGITNEGEAERLARATPAEPPSYPPPCGLPPDMSESSGTPGAKLRPGSRGSQMNCVGME